MSDDGTLTCPGMNPGEEMPRASMRPLADAFEPPAQGGIPDLQAVSVRMIATDVDGTLTRAGALCPRVVASIGELVAAGIEVVPVSGRPAGEVLGLARYLPGVQRAIAENGLLEVVPDRALRWIDGPTDTARLRAVGDHLNRVHGAGLREAADAFCRVGDVAYEREGRDLGTLEALREHARCEGVHLIWSSVHVHLAQAHPDKGHALMRCLERWEIPAETVITVGDAPNDAGLFAPGRFGASVGTADVAASRAAFDHLPVFVSERREADAFLELVRGLLGAG